MLHVKLSSEFLKNQNVDFEGNLFSANNMHVAVACSSYNVTREQ